MDTGYPFDGYECDVSWCSFSIISIGSTIRYLWWILLKNDGIGNEAAGRCGDKGATRQGDGEYCG